MYYYGYNQGYYPGSYTYGYSYPTYGNGQWYTGAIILVLFILLVVVFGAGFINNNN